MNILQVGLRLKVWKLVIVKLNPENNMAQRALMDITVKNRGASGIQHNIVVGAMKMGIIAPRVGTKTTSLAFHISVLTIKPPRLPHVTTLSMPTCLCGSLPENSVYITTLVPLEF